MRTTTLGAGVAVLAVLIAGWLLGLAAQRSIIEATTYANVTPPLLVLGLAMCALGGAAARLLAPQRRGVRTGALAGIVTLLGIVAGYAGLTALYWDRYFAAHQAEGGETWFSLLLEARFWIGVPLVVSSGLGALGWLAADRLAGHGAGARAPRGRPAA